MSDADQGSNAGGASRPLAEPATASPKRNGPIGPVLLLVGALLLLLVAMALKNSLILLPDPPAQAAAGAFDANRAAGRLARILGDERPHPVDSDASDAVRARLIAEMRAVGLEPRVTDDFTCNAFARSRTVACARVRNLVATIPPRDGDDPARRAPGTAANVRGTSAPDHDRPQDGGGGSASEPKHLLLSAHYDSTFAGPGAADAGIGVATLLETAALLRGRPLRRPVTFLFNEGEEMGLLGARAFLERDPLARHVDTLVNLEARGVEGPAVMFETSRPNATALAAFAAVGRPVAISLTTDLYGLIPNSTDVAVFADRSWTILNFAIIGNETRYHSPGDDLAALDRRSLQHMGDQTLALATNLGANPATPGASGQRLYMDLLGRRLVTLPLVPALVLGGPLAFAFGIGAWRRRALGRSLLAMFAATLGSAALAWLGFVLVGLLRAGDFWRGFPLVTITAVYASAVAACLLALLLIARADRSRLRVAFWFFFLLLGGALTLIAPGGAIFFLFPPLLAFLGLVGSRFHPLAERIGGIAAALLLFLTFGPALGLFEELMSSGPHWMFAPLGAIVLLPLLIELLPLARRVPARLAHAAVGAMFALAWIAVFLTPSYSPDRKQLFGVEYVWDEAHRVGQWSVNNDGAPVPFDASWERGEVPWSSRRRWLTPAPAIAVPAPRVELTDQNAEDEGRRLTLRLVANGAQAITLIAEPDAGLVQAVAGGFAGQFPADGGTDPRYFIRCIGRSCDGASFSVLVGHTRPVEFTIVGTRPGVPPQAAPLIRARPTNAQPQYAPDTTLTLARIRL